MQLGFGSGVLVAQVMSGGILVPRKFGALQDVSLDVSFTEKELYGQNSFPIAIARGQGKISGKAKFAALQADVFNDVFFAGTSAAGQTLTQLGEAATIPATPYQITPANATTFGADLGVVDAVTGVPFTKVSITPTVSGTYQITGGSTYLFASVDAGKKVLIDYTYTVTTGKTSTLVNPLMGVAPTFAAIFNVRYNGKQLTWTLPACMTSKFALATKLEDFTIPEFDFKAYADAAGNVLTIGLAE